MTSEIYLCHKCKEQREYIYDHHEVLCAYKPCKCDKINRTIVITNNGRIKPLDHALKTIGENK